MGLTLVFYGAYLLSCEVFEPASRRLCNLAFVLYHAACVLAGCATGLVMSLLHGDRQINLVEEAVSWNQLQFFIWCNLLTGLFNLTISTYEATALVAHAVMFMYFFICVFVISYCRRCKCCNIL